MKKIILFNLMILGCLALAGQPKKLYKAPELTDDVLRIRKESEWKPSTETTGIPSHIDNSTLKFFPAIFEQNGGSCAQSAGMRYLFTYEMNRILDFDAKASKANEYSYYFTWNFLNGGIDQGGFAEQGLNIAQKHGAMSLEDFPDPSTEITFRWESGYDKYYRSMKNRVKEIHTMTVTSRAGIDLAKRYLFDKGNGSRYGGILSFSGYVGDWTINNKYSGPSETGYKSIITALGTTGAHAMTIVGFDDTVEYKSKDGAIHKGAFIGVNSYGTWWGDKGHFYIPYYFFESERLPVILDHEMVGCTCMTYEPKIVFKVKLDYSSRNDISFTMGVGDKYSQSPAFTIQPPIGCNQGGDHPMRGEYIDNPSLIEMAFDFTDLIAKTELYSEPKYYLNVTRSEFGNKTGSGCLLGFSVIDYRTGSPIEYKCNLESPKELKMGLNVFEVLTTDIQKTSGSNLKLVDDTGKTVKTPYVIRTSNGNYAKMQVINFDRNTGTLEIKYLYQSDGSRNISNPIK